MCALRVGMKICAKGDTSQLQEDQINTKIIIIIHSLVVLPKMLNFSFGACHF